MSEIELNIGERLVAMSILPRQANFITLRLKKGLEEKLGPSPDELVEFGMDVKNGVIQLKDGRPWNEKGDEERKMIFGEKEHDMISDALKELDKNNKLEGKHFSLFEKFVDGDKDG